MVRSGGLNVYVPKLKEHMSEKRCALTAESAAEFLGVSKPTAHNILYFMEMTGIIQKVTRGIGFYFLADTYNEDQIEILLREAGARERRAKPKKWVRKRRNRRGRSLVGEHLEGMRSSALDGGLGALSLIGLNRPAPVIPRVEPRSEESPRALRAPTKRKLPKAVSDLPKEMRRLTSKQARYLREKYLTGFKGIEDFTTFFADMRALKRGEYGTVIYTSMGTNSWDTVQKLMIGPSMTPLPEVESRRWEGWAAFTRGLDVLDKPRFKKSKYGVILDQFLEGGHECVSVTVEDRGINYVRIVLSGLIAKRDLAEDVKAYTKRNILYLERKK